MGDSASTGFIGKLFIHRDALQRHLSAPKLRERQAFLEHKEQQGTARKVVRDWASLILHVEALVKPGTDGFVGREEIRAAVEIWLMERGSRRGSQFEAVAHT